MRLGIDFGTTRIVVAAADRGNYPVVRFEAPDGSMQDWFPPLLAVRGSERRYGWDAWGCQVQDGWTMVRSLKRYLAQAGPASLVEISGAELPMLQIITELAERLRHALLEGSNLAVGKVGRLEVMVGVPANANGNQRFLTIEAFRGAGFEVLGLLGEPSAASIEFDQRCRRQGDPARGCVLVYDLGGGTFDASLVELEDRVHLVKDTEGLTTMGGDDFDAALAELALDKAGIPLEQREALGAAETFLLHEECRRRKESLHPQSRRVAVDLESVRSGWPEVVLPVVDFYELCRPMVEETLFVVEELLQRHQLGAGGAAQGLEAIYVTGGGSELPLVARLLKERFGRRVRGSSQARSACAIGLAIQSDAAAGYRVRERLGRHFGVWREADGGRRVVFDPLFPKGTALPGAGEPPLVQMRRYHPVHNVGHFRYLECSHIGADQTPQGEMAAWDEIRFPFDPALADVDQLAGVEVVHCDHCAAERIEERYACDASGAVAVTITNLTRDFVREFRLARWAWAQDPIRPGRRRPRRPPR